MKARKKSKVVNFRMEEKLHETLKRTAIASQKTISELITNIIRDHIDEYSEEALVKQLSQLDEERRMKVVERLYKEGKIKWKSRVKSDDQTEEGKTKWVPRVKSDDQTEEGKKSTKKMDLNAQLG
jgi:hypothetical protein